MSEGGKVGTVWTPHGVLSSSGAAKVPVQRRMCATQPAWHTPHQQQRAVREARAARSQEAPALCLWCLSHLQREDAQVCSEYEKYLSPHALVGALMGPCSSPMSVPRLM